MRRLMAAAVGAAVVLSLTACGQTADDVKRDGEFVKTCHAENGEIAYDGFGGMHCYFGED